jgi:hypothetical protein
MAIIIGSTAIKHYFPDFPREPKDLDFAVMPGEKFEKKGGVEYLENSIIHDYQDQGYLKPGLMISLKASHMFWDNNWDKHLFDIQFLLKKGYSFDYELIDKLVPYWEKILPGVRRSQLESSKDDFFTNAVNEDTEEHDYLHTLINPVPMYTRLLKDGCEVELDELKWWDLTFEEKCDVVFEETAVMAYERYADRPYKVGYRRQLKDNIIKHFPRYIALFAIQHYPILERPKYDYITKIKTSRKDGIKAN